MKTVTYSAPGKVILSGEHAVVYGKPAFVSAVNLRLQVRVETSASAPDGKLGEVVAAVKQFMKYDKKDGCKITIDSEIPVGRGLGSSAALSVAASAALMEFYSGKSQSQEIINNCAYGVEKLFHTNPSGVDTSTSCFGGIIFYRREFDFLKTISKLNMKIPSAIAAKLLLIDSGKPDESTAVMVGMVGKRYNRETAKTDTALGKIEKSTKRLVVGCMTEDTQLFAKSIRENETELERLGVVSSYARKLLRKLKPFGVGKVTGAGGEKNGSGYLLFFAENMNKTEAYLRKHEVAYLPFSPSLVGVHKEV